jgi:predicted RNase H-like HicB family nuclease
MYNYAIRFNEEGGETVIGFCRDFPDLEVFGHSRKEVMNNAQDAISAEMTEMAHNRQIITPASAPKEGEEEVVLPAITVAKITLWNAMIKRRMLKSDLCKLLNVAPVVVDRLTDFSYPSKIHSLEEALSALDSGIRVIAQDHGWVNLAQGGFFVQRLVDAFVGAGVREMPIGKTRGALVGVKSYSLDYILRTRYARQPDTMQAVDTVLQDIEATGYFRCSSMVDPQTGREVDSLALV